MDRTLVACVLAGGTGTRLYPASRPDRPKQFLSFDGDRSLLARTVDRAGFADEVYVLTRPDLADAVREEVPAAGVLTEPEPRDTGPALVYAAHRLREQIGDCVLCVLPSDHHVDGAFADTVRRAAGVAADTGGLVTLGVEPTGPVTGYGYIEPAASLDAEAGRGYAPVTSFHEKPDAATAARYVEAGYRWNAGVFAWTPEALLDAARESPLAPLVEALERGEPEAGFEAVESVSVDRAVLERAREVYVVPAAFEWDDLGTWDALERVCATDAAGNVVLGDTLVIDSEGSVVVGEDVHVSVVGVEDLVVAAAGDRVLVVPKGQAERVREVVSALRDQGRYD